MHWRNYAKKCVKFCADTSTVKKQKHSCLGPTLDVVMPARGRQLNWPGHIDRLEEHRVIRQGFIDCVKPTPDSIFGDVPDLLSREAAELAAEREKWKPLWTFKHC